VPGNGFLVKVVYWLSGVCTVFLYLQLFITTLAHAGKKLSMEFWTI